MAANTESGAGSTKPWPCNPGPLGLAGFGVTTLLLSLWNANLINSVDVLAVLPVALAYGGVAQLLAGMWEFRVGNTFGAVVFSSYGAFWLSFYFLATNELGPIGKAADSAVGAYLWAWAILTILLLLCSFTQPRVTTLIFVLLAITFVLLAIGNSGGTANIIHAGGWFGLATAAAALYSATANIMKDVYGRWVLPVFPAK